MKSHLIPEPKPIDRHLSGTDAARSYLLDQIFSEGDRRTHGKSVEKDDFRPAPEMPMRSFLQVVFVR